MAVGKCSTAILTGIANAIRVQNGTSNVYKPSQMAAAVLALDGEQEGDAGVEPYKALAEGVISSKVFDAIAAAIRSQNGLSATYTPAEMAPAILALEWDVGLKPRAVLFADATLEFNYLEKRKSASSAPKAVTAWEVAPAAYASVADRPWDDAKAKVLKVVIDSSFAEAGTTSGAYCFLGFSSLVEVYGFQYPSGISDATQMFGSCRQLRSIFATSFDYSAVKKSTCMFYGDTRLVGGAGGFVPATTSGASVCKVSAGGMLIDPAADTRRWFYGELFGDGELVLSVGGTSAVRREVLAQGLVCANAKYNGNQCNLWADFQQAGALGEDRGRHEYVAAGEHELLVLRLLSAEDDSGGRQLGVAEERAFGHGDVLQLQGHRWRQRDDVQLVELRVCNDAGGCGGADEYLTAG